MAAKSLGIYPTGFETLRCAETRTAISEQLYPSGSRLGFGRPAQDCYLVDSASSHMLVSKIKPCMSKYKQSIL
jgi:hypothetical protein